jgi:hypothetical protein
MSHPRHHHIRQPHPLNPSSQTVSRTGFSLRANIHPHHDQQRQSHTRAALSPATSQHEEGGGNDNSNHDDSDNNENDQLEENETGKSKKRGAELLRDALEDVSNKRQRRRGHIKYVFSDA